MLILPSMEIFVCNCTFPSVAVQMKPHVQYCIEISLCSQPYSWHLLTSTQSHHTLTFLPCEFSTNINSLLIPARRLSNFLIRKGMLLSAPLIKGDNLMFLLPTGGQMIPLSYTGKHTILLYCTGVRYLFCDAVWSSE